MAIRTRILIVVVALVAIALSILDVISYTVVRRSLLSSADTQLQAATPKFRQALSPFSSGVGCYGLPVNSFGTLYYLDGRAAATVTCPSPVTRSPIARLPASVVAAARHGSSAVVTSVTSASGEQYRVVAELTKAERNAGSAYQQTVSVVFVVGEPLAPVNSTLANVALLEVVMSASVLVAVGAIAFFLVQLGLRPLETMSETAGEIAAGDLTRRVDDTDERTEVGRLGTSLNVMLTRIEEAFRAKEASESQLRRFVADASHELRTPLTSIRGYAELFKDGRSLSPDDLAAALRRIESESARMSGLVDDLLLLARLDQGRPLSEEPVDLSAIARDAATDAGVLAPERQVSFHGADSLTAVGDDARLRQVMVNLVSNALSHTPTGSPLEILAERAGPTAALRVVDHGPGVPASDRVRIFDRFWRADESRQRTKGGAGLGLSIVAAVVAAHHGRVYVEETPGGGATFVVELPVAAPEPQSSPEATGAGRSEAVPPLATVPSRHPE